jgi:Flp pilus assembly protein TadD
MQKAAAGSVLGDFNNAPLLRDPVGSVRIEAARTLAGADPQMLTPEQQTALSATLQKLASAERANADRPEAHVNLGLFQVRRGRAAEAEAQYKTALPLDPSFVPAMVNLADLYRATGRSGRSLLQQGSTDRAQ